MSGAPIEQANELESEKEDSEKSKISFVEASIVIFISVLVELLEWVADISNIVPVLGQILWIASLIFGSMVSVGMFFWSYTRGMYKGKKVAIKLALMIGGPIVDLFTGGLFPETLTLAAAILIHNKFTGKDVEEKEDKIKKAKKAARRLARFLAK